MAWARWLAIWGALCCLGGSAGAENKDKARGLYRAGMQHYNLGEYGEALDAFKAAYREFEEPSFLFNIAQCQRALDQKREAVRSYRTYLRESHDVSAEMRAKVDELVGGLETALREEEAAAKARPAPATTPPATESTTESSPATPPAAGASAPSPSATTLTAKAPARRPPLRKQWWLWTTVGGVVAVGAGVGLGLWLWPRTATYPAATTVGPALRF